MTFSPTVLVEYQAVTCLHWLAAHLADLIAPPLLLSM